MRIRLLMVLALVISIFSSCQRDKNEYSQKIVGDWQLVNFSTNQIIDNPEEYKRAAKELITTTALIIREDGTIKSIIWGTSERGTWEVKKDELVVYDRKHRSKFRAKIVKLTDNQLLLYQKYGKVKIVLYFRRFD